VLRRGPPAFAVVAWSLFCAWCVAGVAPCGDLPAHGAQLQVLAELLRGGPAREVFEAHLSVGYGLTTWLFAPVALVSSGEVAAKAASWLTLTAFPVCAGFLAHRLGRPWALGVLAAPLGFSVSYWYGFLQTFTAGPLVLLAWALLCGHLARPGWRSAAALAGLSLVVLLCHFMAFAALAMGALTLALGAPSARRAAAALALVGAPGLLAVPRVVALAAPAAEGVAGPATRYNLDAHLLGVVKQYPLGARVSLWLYVGVLGLCGAWAAWRWWRERRWDPALGLAVGQLGLFAVMPDDLAGSWRVGVRLVVFVAVAALCAPPWPRVPRWLFAVPAVAVACLAQVHVWFAREVEGLDAVIARPPPPGVHGGLLLTDAAPRGAWLALLEHQPQWWTARWGGLGTHFFADASHQVVQLREGVPLPPALRASTLAPAPLDAALVFGEGELPPELQELTVVQVAGRWRRLERR
jgi:hypothetical protein